MNSDSLIFLDTWSESNFPADSSSVRALGDSVCATIVIKDVIIDVSFLVAVAALGAFVFAMWILRDLLSK
jgi:hypothetical protein